MSEDDRIDAALLTLSIELLQLRDAAEQLQTHVEVLMATGHSRTFNPHCPVMSQMTGAMRSVRFCMDNVPVSVQAHRPGSLAAALAH